MLITNLKILGVVIVTLALYTWVANAIPQIASEVPEEVNFSADVTEAELVAAGDALYNGGGNCVSCHGLGERAPNLLSDHGGTGTIGQRCTDRVPGEDCKAYLYRSLTEPSAYLVEGFDPIMLDQSRTLSANQLWTLVAYLQAQGGEVTVSGADLQAAAVEDAAAPATAGPASASTDPEQLLRDNICLSCHMLGEEGIQLGPTFNGIGGRLTAEEIRTSILDPNAGGSEGFEALVGAMPANFGDQLTATQLEIVVQFLASRR